FPNLYDPRDYISMISIAVHQYGQPLNTIQKYAIYASKNSVDIEGTECIRCNNEMGVISKMYSKIMMIDPDILIGYNSFEFDNEYVHRRYTRFVKAKYTVGLLKHMEGRYVTSPGSRSRDGTPLSVISIPGMHNIDVLQYILNQHSYLRTKTLKGVCEQFLDV